MTKRTVVSLLALFGAFALQAAPAVKAEPVAEGYPGWYGFSEKTHIRGREIGPSDLRHKVAVVVEFEPNDKLQEQLILAGQFAARTGLTSFGWDGGNWETLEIPRDLIVLYVNHGTGKDKGRETIKEALKYKGEDQSVSAALAGYSGMACSMYDDVTFAGAPDTKGKLPYVYVLGYDSKEPLFQDTLTADTYKKANTAISKARAKMKADNFTWRPFYGSVEEVKFFPAVQKAVEKGKPLAQVLKSLLKDVESKDAEKAKEAQILYDAINQTRSDLVMRIKMEVSACPHRAYYDLQKLLKYWPGEKKRLDAAFAKIKANPEAFKLAQIFSKLMVWSDPNFTCKSASEARKIVAELQNKIKKDLEKMKESKVIVVQNGALTIDSMVDELIGVIPTKVPEK